MKERLYDLCRTAGRYLGINKLIGKMLFDGYEEKYSSALFARLEKNDIVFDIGANVGLYVDKFLAANCQVVAFEPDPTTFDYLRSKYESNEYVDLVNSAISNKTGEVYFASINDLGVTNGIAESGEISVQCSTLDDYSLHSNIKPNVLKIDVEGFEIEVLRGAEETLKSVRLIGIEIHYSILKKRGINLPLRDIENILLSYGFKLEKTDPSHIVAWK